MAPKPGLQIGRILGIPIYLHPSWIIIFALITLSLRMQYTQQHPHWSPTQHWTAGILTSVLFFSSVLFHELSHSKVALHYKIPVLSITLFVFGGIARIGKEPGSAKQEFNIAVAGPLSSYFLAIVFFGVARMFPFSEMVGALAIWLAWTNAALATFNLLPGFPMDGGRIFRAIVWGVTKSYVRATKIAGTSGKLIAYGMILFGAWYAMLGQWPTGLWLAFIGWFLLTAAQESVAQVAIREALTGLSAGDVMTHEVPTIGGSLTLEDYGAEVLRTGRRCHLVLTDDRMVGMMNVHKLNGVPREEWATTSVQAAMIPREQVLWATPNEPLLGLLERLLAADINQMPVVAGAGDGGTHVIGMISRDSILRVIQTRSEVAHSAAS
ncbi:MAG: site-2 protease family protein [Acidobacteriia bacterium]|nr:site-2 protease family protein [Terriglobia bacterium]